MCTLLKMKPCTNLIIYNFKAIYNQEHIRRNYTNNNIRISKCNSIGCNLC